MIIVLTIYAFTSLRQQNILTSSAVSGTEFTSRWNSAGIEYNVNDDILNCIKDRKRVIID
jgi:hypothetical protein